MPETLTAPAPSAAPSPSPAPAAPSPSPSGDPTHSALDAAFAKSDFADPPTPEPKSEPAAPAAAKPPEAKKPEVKPAAPVKPTDKPAEPKPAEGPKALREELERTRTEREEFKRKSEEMAVKIKEGEALGKDMEALKARLEARDKEFEAVQGRLRAKEFEASPEFKKQYGEPLERALSDAQETISTMVKTDQTQADFDRDVLPIFHQSKKNYGQAYAAAREAFGDDQAPAIMQHVTELRRLESVHNKALAAEQSNWKERVQQEEGAKVQERQRDNETFWKITEDLKNSNEDYRDPVDDAEIAAERNKGYEMFAALHKAKDKNERMFYDAHIRHQVGAYYAQKLQIARLTAKNAELEASIEEGKTRQPGADPSKPSGGPVAAPEEDWGGAFVKHVRANA
jgi:hypothetical protein